MNHEQIEIMRHLHSRSTNALLAVETLALNMKNVLEDTSTSAESKVWALQQVNETLLRKVMEGTSSLYQLKKS